MQKTRVLGASIALGGLALLTGCVAVPGDPYYSGDYSGGYSQPYYSEPSPVVVAPAPVYIQGGGYYDRGRYYDRRPYYGGRPGYPAVRPGYPAVRPSYPAARPPGGWGGGRPNVGVPGITPSQPQQMPRGNARMWTSPDSKAPVPGGIP
ncbi:hypothetical protein J2W23_004100 [Variovorax boronicumulans]|uniref:hypothetical protein n=1 Tax=Variovorax boronicumulans TaxID=436515 RepID=UPI002784692F|nr:hypothetical protein [Variovorax boronicumulans]MDQ0015700.1 hypothetical protein [Variovorax boronicumulans]